MVKGSADGGGLNGWSMAQRLTRTQRVVNQFSGNQEDGNNDSWLFQYLFAMFRVSDFANFSMETHFPNSSGIHNKMAHRQMAPYFWKP